MKISLLLHLYILLLNKYKKTTITTTKNQQIYIFSFKIEFDDSLVPLLQSNIYYTIQSYTLLLSWWLIYIYMYIVTWRKGLQWYDSWGPLASSFDRRLPGFPTFQHVLERTTRRPESVSEDCKKVFILRSIGWNCTKL